MWSRISAEVPVLPLGVATTLYVCPDTSGTGIEYTVPVGYAPSGPKTIICWETLLPVVMSNTSSDSVLRPLFVISADHVAGSPGGCSVQATALAGGRGFPGRRDRAPRLPVSQGRSQDEGVDGGAIAGEQPAQFGRSAR